jgi:hypothetical protein
MSHHCFICAKNLSNIDTIIDSKCVSYYLEENKYILYFSKQNIHTCIPCGKQLFMWNLSKNKFNLIKNRTIEGTQIKLSKIPCSAHCVMCKQQPKFPHEYLQKFYIKSIGQCCSSCYMAIHNTSTTCDDFEEEMYY